MQLKNSSVFFVQIKIRLGGIINKAEYNIAIQW